MFIYVWQSQKKERQDNLKEEKEKEFATVESNSFEKLSKPQNNKKIANYRDDKEPFGTVTGGPILKKYCTSNGEIWLLHYSYCRPSELSQSIIN